MNESAQTVAIIFSKDRAMQLDACLKSFSLHCKDVRDCCRRVIYTCSNERHEKQYKTLAEIYKEIEFIQERAFKNDLIQAMKDFSHVLFLVDDNIFVRSWSIGKVLEALHDTVLSIGFSLRLGKNITYCYTYNTHQNLPKFEKFSPYILKFNWTDGSKYDFGYPLEVSSSIYRTNDILPIINQSEEINNPNELEISLDKAKNEFSQSHPELFCFETSVAFCNPANIVQHNYLNRFKTESTNSSYSLSKKFDLGYRIDLEPFIDFFPNACHQEVDFGFIRNATETGTLTATVDLKSDYLLDVERKSQTSVMLKPQRAVSYSCELEIKRLNKEELKFVHEFIDLLKTLKSSSKQTPWLLQILQRIDIAKREEIEEAYRIVEATRKRLSVLENLYKDQEKAKLWLEEQREKWELRAHKREKLLVATQQKLESTAEKIRIIEKGFQDEPNQILTSRTFKLATIFRDVKISKKYLFLFPIRFIWFFLPLRIKVPIIKILHTIQYNFLIKKNKPKKFSNKLWPQNKPIVSVVIPCYKYGKYIEEAVNSVLEQTWQDLEIIIVNGSSDEAETITKLNRLDKPKTRMIRQKNLKLPNARNRGIRFAQGKYICCLDADDKIAPTYIEKCVYRSETEGFDICGSWQQNFESDNSIFKPGQFSLKNLLQANRMINAAMFKRSLWKKIGGYDENMMDGYEDWEFWIRMAAAGAKGTTISEPLYANRKHGRSMVSDTMDKPEKIVQLIRTKHSKLIEKIKFNSEESPLNKAKIKNRFINLARARRCPDNQIKILLAIPYCGLGGAERVTSQICSHLSKLGFACTILTTLSTGIEDREMTSWFKSASGEIYNLPRFLPENQWDSFIFYLIFTRNIHILWLVGSSFLYDLLPDIKTRFPSIKIVDLLFNEIGHTNNNRKYYYCIDLTIVENKKLRRLLLDQLYDPDRIKLIENGVDLEKFKPRPRGGISTDWKASSDIRFIAGFFGRFSEEKGPDLFVEIASRFKNRRDIHFVMAGDGPLREMISEQIIAYQLQNSLQLIGVVDVSEELSQCDILVLPSRIDGRPNIVMESLSMGIPVIASNVGDLSGIIADGGTGFLCNIGDMNVVDAADIQISAFANRMLVSK